MTYLNEARLIVSFCLGALVFAPVWWGIGRWARREADERRVPIAWGGLYEQESDVWKNSERVRFVGVQDTKTTAFGRSRSLKSGAEHAAQAHTELELVTREQIRLPSAALPNYGTAVHLTRPQKVALCALILNSRMTRHGLPMSDVPLTLPALASVSIGRKAGDRIRAEVVDLRLGWRDDAGTVYLNRHKAREFVEKARRAGVIGE